MHLLSRGRLVGPLAVLPALLFTGCVATQSGSEVVELVRAERYTAAVELADRLEAENPDDESIRSLAHDARMAYILNEGRRDLLDGNLEDALAHFNEILARDPGNPVVGQWLLKTRDQLTDQWLTAGLELLSSEKMEEALEAYELALYYSPGNTSALSGAGRVLLLINYRQGMGESYYNEGVRAVHEHFNRTARHRFESTHKYIPDHERAELRKSQVKKSLAEQRLFVARGFEDQALWAAAFNEYRLVLLLEPENADALDGRARMAVETKAARLLGEADMLLRQDRMDEALVKLAEGAEITVEQKVEFHRMRNLVEVYHWEALYQSGLNLETDFRFEEAVEAYGRLLDEAEFYEDAADRKRTLEDFIEQADALYAKMLASSDDAERRNLLRQIELFWPEYKDVQERLAELGGN